MQCKDSRIVIYSKNNGGVASAREYGAARAKGDFICFVDQDESGCGLKSIVHSI